MTATSADASGEQAAIDARLSRVRADTLTQIATLSAAVGEIIAAAIDVAVDDEHDPEGQTIAFERAQATALLDQAHARLADIDAAFERVRAGAYGICVRCGQPIAAARLEARPAAALCIGCASKR
jgi:RNA polymerase-binding transcription factor DksA